MFEGGPRLQLSDCRSLNKSSFALVPDFLFHSINTCQKYDCWQVIYRKEKSSAINRVCILYDVSHVIRGRDRR